MHIVEDLVVGVVAGVGIIVCVGLAGGIVFSLYCIYKLWPTSPKTPRV